MVRVVCETCGKALGFRDEDAGKGGRCTGCGARFVVPGMKAKSRSDLPDSQEQDDSLFPKAPR